MDSILTSIKKLLGITEEYTAFDSDIIMYINSAFVTLRQLGAGPEDGFAIEDAETKWTDYSSNKVLIGIIKPYIYRKVKIAFDPPVNSTAVDAIKQAIAEDEWRINLEVDEKDTNDELFINLEVFDRIIELLKSDDYRSEVDKEGGNE